MMHAEYSSIQNFPPEIETGVVTSISMLISSNYFLCVMRMEAYLEVHGLWEGIERTEEK